MAYADARTALKDALHGATAQASGFAQETLTALEYPPQGTPGSGFPYAFVWTPTRTVDHPPMMRHTQARWRVEVILGPYATGVEALSKRMDAWVESLSSVSDLNNSLGGAASVLTMWEFSELRESRDYADMWGFDISIEMELYEAKANDA